MSGQTFRWGLAFAATLAVAAAVTASAASAPRTPAEEPVPTRDPSAVSPVELELILNKIREGDLLALKKDDAGARRAWREARRLGEGLWPIHEGLGDSYVRAKMFEEALVEYRLAGERVPASLAASKLELGAKRAATIGLAGRPLEAIQAYLDLNAPVQLGSWIFNQALSGDPAAAVLLIERHAQVYDPRLYRIVAGLLRRMDRPADAAEAMAKGAIRLEPWNDALNRQVIQELREAKRYDAALEVGRAWVRAVPESIEGYAAMGDVLWDAGRPQEALVAYSSIVDVRPADAAARRALGEIYLRRDRPEDAQAQFEAGLRLQPGLEDLRTRIADYSRTRLVELEKQRKTEEILKLRRRLGELRVQDLGLFDVKVLMTWDVKSDVDLDVLEPDGTLINHRTRVSKVGGFYSADNTTGFGPELYTLAPGAPGRYRVGAHLHSGAKSTVKFVTVLYEGTRREERHEDTVVLEHVGETPVFVRDLVLPEAATK
jgi:tetratricopeptide (TPR) repeat protein